MTDKDRAELRELIERTVRESMAEGPKDEARYIPPLPEGKQFALTVLLAEDDTTIANALADYLLDQGHDYATAVAEKARREEREAIAERLYSESAHVLSRSPDPNDTLEFAAAALSAVADDLVFDRPPTAPTTTEGE